MDQKHGVWTESGSVWNETFENPFRSETRTRPKTEKRNKKIRKKEKCFYLITPISFSRIACHEFHHYTRRKQLQFENACFIRLG